MTRWYCLPHPAWRPLGKPYLGTGMPSPERSAMSLQYRPIVPTIPRTSLVAAHTVRARDPAWGQVMPSPCPLHQTLSSIKHLPGMRHQQNTFLLALFPLLHIDLPIVKISQVDEPAAFLGDSGSQCHRDTRRFDTACGIIGAHSFDVRAVRQDSAGDILETLPLFDEIIPHVVTDLVDQLTMCVGDLADMRGIYDNFAAICDGRFRFVHRLSRRPQVIVDRRCHGEDAPEGARHGNDVELR